MIINENEFDDFFDCIDLLDEYNYIFVNNSFRTYINNVLQDLFPNLDESDIKILLLFICFLIENISIRIYFIKSELDVNNNHYLQWKQNNNRDILAITLQIIPFMDQKNNRENYNKIKDLNQILYDKNSNDIDRLILKKELKESLKKELKYTNFSIGLLIDNNTESLLKLKYGANKKLIYIILHHQFLSILETIKITNGKLYVNWINVRPILNLKKSNIYNQSKLELEYIKLGNINSFKSSLLENKSLWFGDYYNVIRNGYYQSIKKIKWTIFNKKINIDGNFKGFYMIQYLDKMLDFNKIGIYDNDNYLNLLETEKINFKINIGKIYENVKFRNKIYLDYNFEFNIIQNLLVWVLNNSKDKFKIISGNENSILSTFIIEEGNIHIDLTTDDDDLGEEIDNLVINGYKIEREDTIELIDFFIKNNFYEIIWNYLQETIDELKETIYGQYLFTRKSKNTKVINHNFFNFFIKKKNGNIEEIYVNLKNIYNISKQLCYDNDNLMGYNFKNLTIDEQYFYFRNFTDIHVNFVNNIRIQEGKKEYDLNDILKNIKDYWEDNSHHLVLDYLYRNGILSEFSTNLELTNEKLLPSNTNKKRDQVKLLLERKYFDTKKDEEKDEEDEEEEEEMTYLDIDDYNNLKKLDKDVYILDDYNKDDIFESYYYLTNDKYKNLPKFNVKNNKRYDDKKYYKALLKEISFYLFYAMDWIAQINFFNHFIHHQVLFVTGSTGTGKSTQVPKLLMYALKMYDYNNKGKVICTQPRITPTESTSYWISCEAGVQNKKKSKDENLKTDQLYSQYKYQGDKHSKDNCNHLTLKIVTDGTLLEELNNNILMKEQIRIPNTNIKENLYSNKNTYDIMIIDEAHEHNVNMDIILSLARHSCYYNNSLRLVIVSATMDDDEPIYRSYFQMINDNYLYPIKQSIIHPVLSKKFNINANLLDRRVHISAPGQTTQFRIDEYYDENIEKRFGSDERLNSIMAQEESYKTILKICNNTSDGEILLFLTGENEIKKALEFLNEKLPSNVIALPFFSKMSDNYRTIIQNITTQIKDIRNKKKNIVTEWGEKYLKVTDVPAGTYYRSVIVATNVAEASITIPNLKFVVDTGYEKSMQFDPKRDISNLEVKKISEASRVQRKGRVGRVTNGTVYYMYGYGMREDIKPKYGITKVDFHDNFLKLSENNDKTNEILRQLYVNNKLLKTKNKIKESNFENIYLILSNNIEEIKNNQYLNIINLYSMFNYQSILDVKNSGFTHNQLLDNQGYFYIIHPFETLIKRNLMNQIIEYNDSKIYIQKNITRSFNPMLISMEYKSLYLNTNISKENSSYKKTIYSEKIQEVTRDITTSFLDESGSISLLIGKGYGIELEVAEILSLISACNKTPSILASYSKTNKKILEFDKLQDRYKSHSDVISFYYICRLLRNKLKNLQIYELYRNKIIFKKYRKKYSDTIKKFKEEKKFTLEPDREIMKDYNILNQIKRDGKINDEAGFLSWLQGSGFIKEHLKKDLEKNYPKIEKICESEYLNFEIIKNYFKNLTELIIGILTIEKETEKDFGDISPFEWTNKIKNNLLLPLENDVIEERILYTFILTNPVKIGIKMNINDNYFTTINSQDKVIISPLFNKINTFCTDIGGTVFYYNFNTKNDSISIISNINTKTLCKLFPIHYNPTKIKNIYLTHNNIYKFEGYIWDNFIHQVKNYNSFTKFPLLNKRELKHIYNYIKNIQKVNSIKID
jgi:hypothetical protein